MKRYTFHFLVATVVSAALGFSGLVFPGLIVVRIICLFAAIGLMISCLDAVLISRKQRRIGKNSDA